MRYPIFLFKSQALTALRGNWISALLVTFFASLPTTVLQVMRARMLPTADTTDVYALVRSVEAVPDSTWLALSAVSVLATVLVPMLAVSSHHYFVCRLQKRELGAAGVLSRARLWGKALGLYLLIGLKVFLWSLLFIIPGIIALLRYSMAPYYLAEEPELGVREALAKSIAVMKDKKAGYLLLQFSFFGWMLLTLLLELLLYTTSEVLALVLSQFMQLFIATYLNGACASFFLFALDPAAGMRSAREAMSGTPIGAFMEKQGMFEPRGEQEEADEADDGTPSGDDGTPSDDDGTPSDDGAN